MTMRKFLMASVAVTLGTSVGGYASAAAAQAAASPPPADNTIGEVVVTARKREENVQRVPVAVSTASGEVLEQRGVRAVADLQKFVPSLSVDTGGPSNGGTGALFDLRGQAATDNLLTLSQAVGLYEDGVNIPHSPGSNLAFFDVARMEVAKGPQGTLYGRNTTGGAINIITKDADFNGVHGFVEGEAGNYQDKKVTGAVNVPIIDQVLAARLAFQQWDREGFGQSVTTGERLGADHNDTAVRLSVTFNPLSTVWSKLQLEYDDAKQHGSLWTPVYNNGGANLEAGLESGAKLVPGAFCGSLPFTCASVAAVSAVGAAALAPSVGSSNMFVNGQNEYAFDHVKVLHGGATVGWDMPNGAQLKSITGYHWIEEFQNFDLDETPFQLLEINAPPVAGIASAIPIKPEVKDRFVSQEFNLSGAAFDNRFDWLVGAFGSWDRGSTVQPFTASTLLLANLNSALDAALGTPGGVYSAGGGAHDAGKVTSDSWALFTQNDIHLSDQVSLTLGARYTEERLGLVATDYSFDAGSGEYFCTDAPKAANGTLTPVPLAQLNSCTVGSTAKFSGTSYLASFNYQVTPDILVYVKTARGFRGGALQEREPTFPAASPEIAVDYELGFKGQFFEHRLQTNLAAYQTNYSNKQQNTIIPTPSGGSATVTQNAADARIRGLEGEFTAKPATGLTLYGSFTFLDGVFTRFPNALTPSNVFIDASGYAFPEPKWRYALGGRYTKPVGPGELAVQGDWSWRGRTPTTLLNTDTVYQAGVAPATSLSDPNMAALLAVDEQLRKPIGLLNARLEYNLPDRGLTFAVFATNLLDKHYQLAGLAGNAIGGITTATTQEPRMWGVSVRKSFGRE